MLAIDPVKDVDGVHPFNAGQLYLGRPTLVPATPLGIMALLDEYQIGLDGTRAVVIGRSDIVGKPIAHLLLQANATVTICHSHTDRPRAAHARRGRAGRRGRVSPGIVSPDMVKSGAAVVDVGINRTEAGLGRRRRPRRGRHRADFLDARSRRRRPDDDRDAPAQHAARRALPPRASCVSRSPSANLRAASQ